MSSPLAVYIHIPFCTIKCGYCDFNAYAGMDALKTSYTEALCHEIASSMPLFRDRTITSIGFGGGTPGEMPAESLAAIIEAVRSAATVAPGAEISLEANPGTTGAEAVARLHAAGVNRISFGAQSFHADELRVLDRIHSPEAIAAAVHLARQAAIPSVGLDLIYGLPGQSPASWRASLQAAIALEVDHISCYALTVEEGTPLALRVASGEVQMPTADAAADLYDIATAALAQAGFEQYELSNWARPGHESRHNRAYWTDTDYLGFGAGAHGYLSGERYENIAHPRAYIAAAATGTTPLPAIHDRYIPDRATAMCDWFATRTRLLEGFDPVEFEQRFGEPLSLVAGPTLEECHAAGILELTPRVRLSPRGRLLHGEVSAHFLASLSTRL